MLDVQFNFSIKGNAEDLLFIFAIYLKVFSISGPFFFACGCKVVGIYREDLFARILHIYIT